MKISTKGIYGLEAVVDLALNRDRSPVSLNEISKRCGISEAYILQIFLKLRRAGIVKSIRGAGGGYILANDIADITVNDILKVLEGDFFPAACKAEDGCVRSGKCASEIFWQGMDETIEKISNSITLKDLVECCNSRSEEPEFYL